MAALHLAYLHFGFGPGDEVIAPAQTHVATCHAIEWVGAKPIFVDCDPKTGNLTADRIERALTPKTKAITLVHYVGIPCGMTAIMRVAESHKLKVIEDCAIALGATWKGVHVGLFGDVGTFSFYPVKHITTAEGGMFISRHKDVADAVAKLRAFGVDRTHTERAVPGMYDVPSLGLNYRMSEIQAVLGRTQLAKFEKNLEIRRKNFETLKEGLRGLANVRIIDSGTPDAVNTHYCLVAVLENALAAKRNDVIAKLNAAGVGTSVYYPQPVNRMKYYRNKYGYDPSQVSGAADISDHGIALPVGPHLSQEDLSHVIKTFRSVVEEAV
jgi:dTDP-4-amino-4,6-dideoxygalactose transaminase